jgi:D-alanyl-D-alanine carboxypeptidase
VDVGADIVRGGAVGVYMPSSILRHILLVTILLASVGVLGAACAPVAPTAAPHAIEPTPAAPGIEPTSGQSAIEATPVTPAIEPTAVPPAIEAAPAPPAIEPTPVTTATEVTAASPPIEAARAPPAVEPTPVPPPVEPTPVEPTVAPTQQPALKALPNAPRRLSELAPPYVSAEHVAIVDEDSGALLYGEAEHDRVAPASITKIATTLVALEHAPDLAMRVNVTVSGSALAARTGSSIMGLEPGENVSLETLLFGMMLPSGNDAAEQVAVALAGSRETYIHWMNDRVAQLGLQDTHFVNPHGLDANGHYSSAYDMALLGREAMHNPTFARLAGAATYRGDGFQLANLNRLIGFYAGADGIKIGYTGRAGKTIVASATHGGHRVYVTLMHSADLTGESSALFNWVWKTFAW